MRDLHRVQEALEHCGGVVHLAAVSRVIWGERAPELCRDTNIGGVRNVLEAALAKRQPPWLLFASSREVYGQPQRLPAKEDTPLRPVNVYGRSKVEGERLVRAAGEQGLRVAIARFSNVYGDATDHVDRVVPAFTRAAVSDCSMRMEGADCTFDFTHVEDAVRGIAKLIDRLERGITSPPVHFLTGIPTSLRQLAATATALAGQKPRIIEMPPRSFDVSRFYGDPSRAAEMLGWEPCVSLRDGLERLVRDLRAEAVPATQQEVES